MDKHFLTCKGIQNLALSLLFLSIFMVFPQSFALASENTKNVEQSDEITLKVDNQPIKNVLALIERKTGYAVGYNANLAGMDRLVSVNLHGASISAAMQSVLRGSGLGYKITGRQILIFQKAQSATTRGGAGQEITASGTVTDATGNPLMGVTVKNEAGKTVAVTDMDGHFSSQVRPGERLSLSYIGFRDKDVRAGGNLNVAMQEDKELLDEVVVVGYGTMKKGDLTGSISAINEKDFNKGLISSPSQMLQGRVTGVNVTNNGGEPGGGVTIRVRGSNSIRSGQDPLYVVDGVPLNISDDQQPGGASVSGGGSPGTTNPLSFLNPDDIERIDILKDASATAIYGARGANGVIMITTKKGGEGAMKVSYSAQGTVSWLPEQYDVMSADEFRAAAKQYGYEIDDRGANTNWQDEIFRTSFSNSHNLTLSGGTKKSSYRASIGYQDQQGIIKTSSM